MSENKTKHTPGPWRIGDRLGEVVVRDVAEERQVARALTEANARLIAAAPELLEALKELFATVKGECPSLLDEDSGGNSRLAIEIEKAIAKAEGKS